MVWFALWNIHLAQLCLLIAQDIHTVWAVSIFCNEYSLHCILPSMSFGHVSVHPSGTGSPGGDGPACASHSRPSHHDRLHHQHQGPSRSHKDHPAPHRCAANEIHDHREASGSAQCLCSESGRSPLSSINHTSCSSTETWYCLFIDGYSSIVTVRIFY